MKNTLLAYIDRFRHDRRERVMLGSVLLVLAIIVTLVVYWQLRLSGVAMTNATYCGYEEHVHTEECYEEMLTCGLEETEGHAHTDECYEEQQVLVCGLEESEEHTHDESCYEMRLVLVCGLEEYEGHTHTDECYEQTLICGLEEHTHTVECLVDLTADVEDATIWETTLPVLTGDLRTDVVNIAYSQLGYVESVANYTLGEDGVTHLGYTRYGAWYGNAYSDWDSMFVAFCLEYADIAEEFTFNAGAYAWSIDLSNLGYYQLAENYSPTDGDILFLDVDSDGKADNTAVVVAVDESLQTVTVIQGNYSVTDSEGDTIDTVALVTYTSPVILGYANLTPEEAVEEVAEEVTEEVAEVAEEIASEEVTEELTESDGEALTAFAEEVIEADEGETEANEIADEPTTVDYVAQVTALYTQAMSLTEGDTESAATVWDELMAIWEQIYAEEDAGTLALTDEEYDNVNALTDEVYDYFAETVGYDPYGVMTLSLTASNDSITLNGETYRTFESVEATVTWSQQLDDEGNIIDPYYNSNKGIVYVPLNVDFAGLTANALNESVSGNYGFYIEVPSNVVPAALGSFKYESSSLSFTYTFYFDESTNKYYILIDFDEKDYPETGYEGGVSFEAAFGEEDVGEQIIIEYNDKKEIEIDADDINGDGNENFDADISVSKTASQYDAESGTMTYEIIVSSIKGTDGYAITLEDLMAVTGDDISISKVEITSIESATLYTTYYGSYQEQSTSDWTNITSSYTTDATTSGFTLTLPAISSETSGDTVTSSEYKITYTVYFDTTSTEISGKIENEATSTVEEKDIEATVDISKSINTSLVSKSGTASSDGKTITWTITVNPNNLNVAGYSFYDEMLADATTGSITITDKSGNTVSAEYYTRVEDSEGNVIGYTFGVDADGDGELDPDYNTYYITYTTSVDDVALGESTTKENTVSVKDGDGNEVTSDSSTVNVSGNNGSVNKEYTGKEENDDGTLTLNWTTTVSVPEGGIASGTVLIDWLGVNTNYQTSYLYDSNEQYFTYTQICNLFSSLTGDEITIGSTAIEYDKEAPDYTLEAYNVTTGEWVSYSDLSSKTNDYSSDHFTAYRITFNEDIECSGDWVISYSTTADISGVTTQTTYWNSVDINGKKDSASYTEKNPVYKTDGNGVLLNTSHTTTDGTVTWRVYVYTGGTTTGDDITIIDTLPTGVSLVSADIYYGYTYGTPKSEITESEGTWKSRLEDITVSVEEDTGSKKVVTIKIPYDVYSTFGSDDYIIVVYTCKLDDFDTYYLIEGNTWDPMTNSATVKIGSEEYGPVKQTQTIEYKYSTDTEDGDEVSKGYTFDSNNSILNFYVVTDLDLTSDELKDLDEITFTDELSAAYHLDPDPTEYYNTSWGQIVTLNRDSVNFYELAELISDTGNGGYYYTITLSDGSTSTVHIDSYSESDVYVADNGTVYYKYLLDIDWTYTTTSDGDASSTSGLTTKHVITATITPVVSKLYVEYSYTVIKNYSHSYSNSSMSSFSSSHCLYNKATVAGTTTNSLYPNDEYEEVNVSAWGGANGGGLTLTKVDGESFKSALSGATYALYYYDASYDNGEYTYTEKDTGLTFTTGTDGTFTVARAANGLSYNTLYYLVEIDAPEGYILDSDTRYYFYWSDEDGQNYSCVGDFADIIDTSWYADMESVSAYVYASNYKSPDTSLTVLKKDSDTNHLIDGAVFTLQQWDPDEGTNGDWVNVLDDNGNTITFTTNALGKIEVSPTASNYTLSYNQAYRLLETTFPDGYVISSEVAVYFWWHSSSTSYEEVKPSVWTYGTTSTYDGSSTSKVINLSSADAEAEVYNNPIPTTSVSVEKSWTVLNDTGTDVTASTDLSTYAAKAQLYYYLVPDGTTSEGDSGTKTVNVYFADYNVGSWGTTESSLTGYIYYTLPVGEKVTITVNGTGGWGYTYAFYSNGDNEEVTSTQKSLPYTVEFEVSNDYAFYLLCGVSGTAVKELTSIVISYTDSDNTYYEYTYTPTGDWVRTQPAASTPTPSSSTATYKGLVGTLGTDYTGYPYVNDDGNYVYASLYYNNGFSETISDLPQYVYITKNGVTTKYLYYYYFVETSASDSTTGTDNNGVTYVTNAEYSTADGVTNADTPITITNTVTKTDSVLLPSTGGTGAKLLYEFGGMLILLALVGAGGYRNLSRLRKSLVSEPTQEKVSCGEHRKRVPGMRNRKFVTHRHPRKGDTRAGPDG